MQSPTINNNGTAPSDLLIQHLEAMKHVRRVIEAVQGACPRGRDYMPLGSPVGHDPTGKRAGQAFFLPVADCNFVI
jgi:hypothetical protein